MRLPVPGLTIENQPDDVLHAMLVWGEARGESREGKLAVAYVAVNRALKWERRLASVILRPWQFSCFNPNDPNREKLLHPEQHGSLATWEECWLLAEAARGRLEPDPSHGATHYTVVSLWGSEAVTAGGKFLWYSAEALRRKVTRETARIGNHVFGVST